MFHRLFSLMILISLAATVGVTHAVAANSFEITSEKIEITIQAVGNEIMAWVNGEPVRGIVPFIDSSPVLGPGRVGAGQITNPTYYDNFSLISLDPPGFQPGTVLAAAGDPPVIMSLSIPEGCNATQAVSYTIESSDAGVASAGPLPFSPAGPTFASFALNINDPGTTTLSTSNDGGCADVPPATVTVLSR